MWCPQSGLFKSVANSDTSIMHYALCIVHFCTAPVICLHKRGGIYVTQIYGSELQRGHLPLRRTAFGICNRRGGGTAGRKDLLHRGAGKMPLFRHLGRPGRLRDPLELHQADRSGYHFGRHKTGYLPCSPAKVRFSHIKSRIFLVFLKKILAKSKLFLYNNSAWAKTHDITTPHTR